MPIDSNTPPETREPFVEHRHNGRRNGDLAGLFANRWARYIGLALLPVIGGGINELKNWYLSVPSVGWQSSVSTSMQEQQKLRVEFIQLTTKVETLAVSVDDNAVRAEVDRQELKAELVGLRSELQRWFEKAANARVIR